MNDEPGAEQSTAAAAANSISRGTRVDWNALVAAGFPEHRDDVLAELQSLETLAQLSRPVPAFWGPFVILNEIGRGAFGIVYRAHDPNLEVDVALKVIKIKGSTADPSRALSEARRLAQVSNPNVVRVYRAEHLGDEVGIAMELVRGTSLDTLVRQDGPYSAREAIVIGIDLCRALAAVHRANVLHCDIKAPNVMRADGGRIVLMDFGSARHLTNDATAGGMLTGTPLYLAPEVFDGHAPTRASDIYSVGVLLYFLTTGQFPVDGSTFSQVERRHAERTPPRPLRDVRADLPDSFIRIVDRTLAQRPDDRYQSADELENDLLKAHDSERPRPRPWWRGPITLSAAAAVVAIAVGSLSFRDRMFSSNNQPERTIDATTTANAASTTALDEYRIHAALYRDQDGVEVPIANGSRIYAGDKLSLQVRATRPIYLYVVNEDENGESYLLYPLDAEAAMRPLAADQRHRLPTASGREQVSWQVTSRGGREHFLIFASPQPPAPAFAQLFAELPRPLPGKPVNYHQLSPQAAQLLRGVGGVVATGARSGRDGRLIGEFTVPLGSDEERIGGVWVRQITLDNP